MSAKQENTKNVRALLNSERFNSCYFLITYHCSNKCAFCLATDKQGEKSGLHVPTEEALKYIYKVGARIGGFKSINVSGGETMLHPDIIHFLKLVRRLVPRVQLNSNGTMLDDEATFREVSKYVDRFIFSLHGSSEKKHNLTVGNRKSFKTVLAAIRNCENTGAEYSVNVVATSDNFPHLPEIVKFISTLGTPCSILVSNIVPVGLAKNNYRGIAFSLKDMAAGAAAIIDSVSGNDKAHVQFAGFPPCTLGGYYWKANDFELMDSYGFWPVFEKGEFKSMDVFFRPELLKKTKAKVCRKCAVEKQCQGIFEDYLSLFGAEGINPIAAI